MASDPSTTDQRTISARGAQQVLAAAAAAAEEAGAPSTLAVVGADGLLKAYLRMDGAPLIGIDVAKLKAGTAVSMGGVDTAKLVENISGNAHLLAALSGLPGVALLPGGLPLRVDGVLVGAIGVSAPTGTMDMQIAAAGVAGLTVLQQPV